MKNRDQLRQDRIHDLEAARDAAEAGSAEHVKAVVELSRLQGVDRADAPTPPAARIPKDHLDHLQQLLRSANSMRRAAERKGSMTAASKYLAMEEELAEKVQVEIARRKAADSKPDAMPMEEWLALLRARAAQLSLPELDQFASVWFGRHNADPATFLRFLQVEATAADAAQQEAG